MAKFSANYKVDIHEVDFNGVAKASALLRYVQSTAQAQLNGVGLSYEELISQNRAFLLSKVKLEFDVPVREAELLTAYTWPCDSRGYTFTRCYELERDGVQIGRAVSAWALIDPESRALVRVNDFDLPLETHAPLEMPLGRIRVPESMVDVGEYTVTYAVTDQNRHMNNTTYADLYANFLPMEEKRIRTLSIHYLKEAPMGERLRVQMAQEGEVSYFRTVRQDGEVNTLAEVVLTKI